VPLGTKKHIKQWSQSNNFALLLTSPIMLNYNRAIDIPNYGNKIYLNNAGSSIMPLTVRNIIKEYLDKELEIGGYKLADLRETAIEQFYQETARLLHCQARNIAFAHDATDAYLKALSSIPFQKGDVILTTNNDYSSNQIQFISLQKRYGITIKRIGSTPNGDLDIAHFQQLLQEQLPKLVAITHVPTNSGLIQDVETIGQFCEQLDILYLVDACQSVGQLEVNVQQIKCDFLSATGRKFLRGPRGTGLLYVSDKVLEGGYAPLLIDGWGAKWTDINQFTMLPTAKRFETWERSYALVLGEAEAIRIANQLGIPAIEKQNQLLQKHLRANLASIKGVHQYDYGSQTANLVTFQKEGITLEQLQAHLDAHQVYYSVSTLNWGLIDFQEKGVDWVIRFSPHYINTLEEMDRVADIIESCP